jgi:hypothetical protein
MGVADAENQPIFSAHTVVDFKDECDGTRMTVAQTYTLFQPIAEMMVGGAGQGWKETLDRLGRALAYTLKD